VRLVNVTGVSVGVSITAGQERGEEPHITSLGRIELTGTMDEPVRDTRDVDYGVCRRPKARLQPGAVDWPRSWDSAFDASGHLHSPSRFRPRVVVGSLGVVEARAYVPYPAALSVGLRAQHLVLDVP
jgi:hypothetical protein